MRTLPRQNQSELDYNDAFYVKRLQTLQAVDELVGALVDKLVELGMDDNTYVMYTSDNGYHMGQHRLQPGKQCAFEEDVNVPFLVRGPGVPKGQTVDFPTSHTDVSLPQLTAGHFQIPSFFVGSFLDLTFCSCSGVYVSCGIPAMPC